MPANTKQELVIHGVYRHFKGNYYLVEAVAIDSENRKELVIYRPLYGDTKVLYARAKTMFLSEVDRQKYPAAKQKYRFQLKALKDETR